MKNNPRKQQIIKAAQKRFTRHGLNKTSVEEIARDLRVGKATIYHYFESKEEIFYVVLQMEIDRFLDELKQILAETEPDFNIKFTKIIELKSKLQEKYVLIFELMNILITHEPLEKEKQLFGNLISSEKNILADYLKSVFSKKQVDAALIDFLAIQSWGIILAGKLFPNNGELQAGSSMLTKFIEQMVRS